jgi:putative NADH-flavin reductase
MNLLVIGASQGTGALCVRQALGAGHRVTAFARSPQRLGFDHANLRKLAGDFHQEASVSAAVSGHDAVIVTASATRLKAFKENPRYFSQGTAYVVAAMKASSARRLVILSAFGVGESRQQANFLLRALMIDGILRTPFEDHERQEALVRESPLEWVIARPGRLTNGPARARYVTGTGAQRVPASISRADLAHFLVQACQVPTWVRQAVQLGG